MTPDDLLPLPAPQRSLFLRVKCIAAERRETKTKKTYVALTLHVVGTRYRLHFNLLNGAWVTSEALRAFRLPEADVSWTDGLEFIGRSCYAQVKYRDGEYAGWEVNRLTRYRRQPHDNELAKL